MQKHKKINRLGIFDSGIGGLNVFDIVKNIDCQEIIYIADTANLPYGDKSAVAIIAASSLVVEQLILHHVDTIIVACHTASAIALPFLRAQFPDIQFIGMIELTIQAAVEATKTGHVGLLATQATITHGIYEKELHRNNILVQSIACPLLVPLIEQQEKPNEISKVIKQYTHNLKDTIDTLILGCTHYDLIHDLIKEILPHMKIIHSKILFRISTQTCKKCPPKHTLLATGKVPYNLNDYLSVRGE